MSSGQEGGEAPAPAPRPPQTASPRGFLSEVSHQNVPFSPGFVPSPLPGAPGRVGAASPGSGAAVMFPVRICFKQGKSGSPQRWGWVPWFWWCLRPLDKHFCGWSQITAPMLHSGLHLPDDLGFNPAPCMLREPKPTIVPCSFPSQAWMVLTEQLLCSLSFGFRDAPSPCCILGASRML